MNYESMIRHITQMTLGGQLRVQMMRFGVPLLLMLVVGVNEVWGQTKPVGNDYSGTYYIANSNKNTTFLNSTTRDNRYYLCPSTSNYADQQPFVTTHKIEEGNFKWTVEFVKTENYIDYYHIYILDNSTNKYLTYHTSLGSNIEARARVHLQSSADGDKSLFYFTTSTYGDKRGFNIIPKSDTSNRSLNPAKANTDSYAGVSNGAGTWNSIDLGGLIGLWAANNETGVWYLEDVVSNPVVSINSDGNAVISSSDVSATFYYTTDGTTAPTTGSTQYTGPIDVSSIETIKAIAVVNGESSNVATYTVGTGMPYIIQNQECTAYYLVSGDPAAANVPANTSSIAGPKMEWLLKYAGNVNGIQYYYFINNGTNNYLYRTGDNIYVKAFADNDDGYKFNFLTQNTDGSYNIYAKDVTNKSLYKEGANGEGGNINSHNVKLNAALTNNRAQWKFISTSAVTDKRTLFEASPVAASNYYKIASLGTPGWYIISSVESGGTEYAGVSDTETNDNMVWMFEEAGHDEWQTYYNIVSATTGKYMYYVGPAAPSTSTQVNAIEMKDNITENERYQFVLARATDADYYYIIPKTHKDVFKDNKYYGIWLDTSILKTINHRATGGINVKWKFEDAPSTFVAPPMVTFNADEMKVYMESSTQDITKIQYSFTKDAEAAPTMATIDYPSGGIDVKYGPVYHFAAKTIKEGSGESTLVFKNIDLSYIEVPTIEVSGSTVTFSTSQKGMTFYYTTDGSTPKYTDKNASDNHGIPIASNSENKAVVTFGAGLYDLRVIAVSIMDDANETGYSSSASDVKTIDLRVLTDIYSLADIQSQTGLYKMTSTFSATGTPKVDGTGDEIGTASKPFKGTIQGCWDDANGTFKAISLSKPLFECVEDATIRDVIVAEGDISGNGAIAAVAKGQARIYNCGYLGGTITGSGSVGGIVGEIQDEARVVNCFSFAKVSGGTTRGGIVGNNNVTTASKKGSINTMVMNCMFYGTIDGGGAPVYNGTKISNAGADGLNNFNYYSFDDFQGTPSPYNCALAAEKIYLERFEFHRNILNSNRELAAWYATGRTGNSGEMAKWVLDKSIAKYPILKKQGYYPSVINYEDAPSSATISISVSQGNGAPTDASIGSCPARKIYDKDIENHHYNHKTIRLPYYSEVGGTGNYTNNKVMTGWEVTVSGGKNFTGTFTHNYANRDYSAYSGRVFSQGAYLDIPEGATSVSITSHWADCVYLSDPTYDVTYSTDYNTPTYVDDMGTRYGGEKKFNGQDVYTTFNDALDHLDASSGTVYDHAIVLVGNYHQYCKATAMANSTKLFTVMSADLNNDCEPDYSFFYQHTQRHQIAPVRFDFLNFPGIGLGQKVDGTGNMAAQGIFVPRGWFEITNTCLVHFTQFEYDSSSKTSISPVILLGGIYDQFVSANDFNVGKTSYLHLGSNAYFPNEFCNGTHGDKSWATPHIPISVTGGEYKDFYLSGMFNPDVVPIADNASCYVDGGYFSEEVAGAGQEKIDGNVTWYIANADITNFYGGGINDAKSITGDITVNIKNSRVDQYCGGPKFGNMSDGKKITTTATDNCIFGKFFGAGYGGTSLYQRRTQNDYKKANYSWSTWAGEYDTAFDGGYNATYHGVPTSYKYEYVDRSGAEDNTKVGRFYINYASLSLAVTHDVESTLTDCTIKSDFFGGGNLGMVNGNIESTLTDCTVHGSVFGGGFSATPPTVDVWPKNSFGAPSYNDNAGVYIPGEYPDTEEEGMIVYTWSHDKGSASSPLTKEGNNYWIYTAKDTENNKDLSKLGQVTGDVTLTIDGESKVGKILHGIWDKTQNKLVVDTNNEKSSEGGGVFGGGDASAVLGSTLITLKGNAEIKGNVFGGGNEAPVSGSATVNIEE